MFFKGETGQKKTLLPHRDEVALQKGIQGFFVQKKKKYVLLLSRICNTRVPGDYYEPDTTLTMSKMIDKDCFLNFKAIIPCTFIQNCVVP